MRTVDEFARTVVENADVGIRMRDGCRLSARIWMPEDANQSPVPAILEHLPYRKRDGTAARDCLTHPYFAGHGYACVRVDMRGSGDSNGLMEDEYTAQELQDACEVIAWLSQQPWCNGNVGMMGISWGGFNSLQVAALKPPALKAIITICSTVDRYGDDIHYKGGCLLGKCFGWATTMLAYSSRPPDPAIAGDNWRDMWLNRLEHLPFLIRPWLEHQTRDDYWKHGSVCEDYRAIDAAVLSIGGWHDGYRNTISHLVENLAAPVKGIVGPWNHKYPHFAAPKPAIGFLQEALRWWDRWLKDADTGVEHDAAYRVYLMDSIPPAPWLPERPGSWIAEGNWPVPDREIRRLHLGANALVRDAEEIEIDVMSPEDCGLQMGEYFPYVYGPELPDNQLDDDDKSACFDGEAIAETLDIVGAPEVLLRVRSDQENAKIAVRLCDLRPDGTSALITYQVFNLAHRRSHERPLPLVPGELVDVRLNLDQIAYRVPAGHKLRLAVSTALWPFIWPSPKPTRLTLLGGSLALPIRTRTANGNECAFESPEGARPWRIRERRAGRAQRHIERSDENNATALIVDNDFGEVEDLEHGLISGSRTRERWSISPDDPLSALAEIEWETTTGRGDWMVRTNIQTHMWATETDFHATAELTAQENGEMVFQRKYEHTVPRNFN